MFRKILFPTDGSDLSLKSTATVVALAQLHGAQLVSVSVIQPFPFVPVGDTGVSLTPEPAVYETQMRTVAQDNVDKVAGAASAGKVPFEGVVGFTASPYEFIVETAEKHGCDLIVMASHGRTGLNKLILGSETQKVLSHTHLPVLVLR